MMKKVQEMQSKMQEVQKELESKTVEANAGGGMVSLVMNGKQQVQSINIDPSLLNEDEKEVLEDLIKAALNQAKEKVDEMSAEEMKKVTGGLPLPPGMKLPF
ncbi:MAG: YbaB/EbfC family nucleoid-associated protein [Alphaproteobacteria bacterium]|jgi:nucleoid-associated protein EbfC